MLLLWKRVLKNLNLRIEEARGYETMELNEIVSDWPETGLTQGGAYSGYVGERIDDDTEEIIVMPVLIGTSDKGGKKTYACGEQYGYVVV